MRQLFALVLVLAGSSAWAVGERVVVQPAAEALRDTICVSMNCVRGGGKDALVAARSTKDGLEVTVTNTAGEVKLVHVIPRDEAGGLSSIEVVRASSLVVQAIEAPTKPQKLAKPVKRHRPAKLFARR